MYANKSSSRLLKIQPENPFSQEVVAKSKSNLFSMRNIAIGAGALALAGATAYLGYKVPHSDIPYKVEQAFSNLKARSAEIPYLRQSIPVRFGILGRKVKKQFGNLLPSKERVGDLIDKGREFMYFAGPDEALTESIKQDLGAGLTMGQVIEGGGATPGYYVV